MRAIMESSFYIIYLFFIIGIGIYISFFSKNKKRNLLFGLACIILGFGDAFHLIPRAVGLFTKTLDDPSKILDMWLGIGKLITSITMTIFYLLLYYYLKKRFNLKNNNIIDICVILLVVNRLILCAFPQNNWVSNESPLSWGIMRNIPFTILGILVIVYSYINVRKEKYFNFLWLLIILSFGFYLPVVLFASKYPLVGMLMLPKTICYMLIGIIGLNDTNKINEDTQE